MNLPLQPLMAGRFKGTPLAARIRIADIRPAQFARWRHLFRQIVERLRPPEAAAQFVAKWQMISERLKLGFAASRDGGRPARSEPAPRQPPSDRMD